MAIAYAPVSVLSGPSMYPYPVFPIYPFPYKTIGNTRYVYAQALPPPLPRHYPVWPGWNISHPFAYSSSTSQIRV